MKIVECLDFPNFLKNGIPNKKRYRLIAYFSWSGNTRQLAGMIQEQIGGELFEIEPEAPYTDDINALSGISLQEQQDDIRPALKSSVEDMSQYSVIFIGFPNMEQGFESVLCA